MQERLMRIVDGWFQVFQKTGTHAEFQTMLDSLKQTLEGEVRNRPEFTPEMKRAVDERVLAKIDETYRTSSGFFRQMWDGRWGPWELA